MLSSIKKTVGRGVSIVGAVAMFVIMLPLTLAATVIMIFAGMIAVANLRQRLKEAQHDVQWQNKADADLFSEEKPQRPPIEGHYTVVEK